MAEDLKNQLTRFEMLMSNGEKAIILTPATISDEDLEKLKKYLESLKGQVGVWIK